MSSAAIHATQQPSVNTPPLVAASPSGRHPYASAAHSSPTREGYHANAQHSSPASQRQSRRTAAPVDLSADPSHGASPASQSNSPMSSRAAIASPVAVATGNPEYQTSAPERRRHHAPSAVPPRTSSSQTASATGQSSSRRSAAAGERSQSSPRRAQTGADQRPASQGEHSSNSRRKERQHYAPAPPQDASQRASSSHNPRASGPPTVMPVRTHSGVPSVASSSKGPSREASEILHSILVSPPEVDIDREKERMAQAQRHPAPPDQSVDDAAPPPIVVPVEARGARSRHDHSKREKQTKFGDYILGNTIGEGEFGKVKLGWKQEGGVQVAIKLIKKDALGSNPSRMNKIMREVQILKQLTHPNIVRLHRMEESERHYGIILEYASGGELFDYILNNRYLKDNAARRLFAQLVSGVGYLHKKGIVHRDLKLENLLLDRNRNIIITDFGFANMFDPNEELTEEEEAGLSDKDFVKRNGLDKIGANNSRKGDLMLTSCGSPCYAAPELVVSDSLYTGRKVDVWSCGVILYAMLAGYLPFDDDPANPEGDNINLLYKYIVNTPLTFPEYVTPHAKDLLRRILVPNPRRRADLFEVARHSWLSEYAHVVEFITSSTTTHTDIQNTTVPSEEMENGGIVRSASVRESSRKTPVSPPVGGLASKQGGIDQDAENARQQKDNKRRTVQVEYVAPVTQTQRGESSNAQTTPKTKTRARSGSEGPVEVASASPGEKPLPKDPPVSRDSYARTSSRGDPRKPPSSHRNQPMTTRPPVSARVGPDGAYMTPAAGSGRPNTSGSMASTGSRVPVATSRSSYGQPLPPAVAGTNVHGRIQQPAGSGKSYVVSPLSPDTQDADYGRPSVSVPSKFAKVSGFSGEGEQAEASSGKSGHRRSNTLGEITGKMFGRSGSLFGNKNRKKPDQPQQQAPQPQQSEPKGNRRYPPVSMISNTVPSTPGLEYDSRQSIDSRRSRRSFSFGLGKKRSGSVAGSQTSLDKQTKRFSFIPNSISLKGMGIGKDAVPPADDSQNDLPIQEPPMVDQYGRYVDQRLDSSHDVNASTVDGMYAQLSDPQHAAAAAGSAPSLSGQASARHQRYTSGQYDERQQKPSAVPGYLQHRGAALNSGSESSVNEPRGTGRIPPGSSSSFHQHQRPQDQFSASSEFQGQRYASPQSASDVRGGRGVLQKPKRFVDAYDTDENSNRTHDHGGSSGAARRVMDFFRRRGKARGGDDR